MTDLPITGLPEAEGGGREVDLNAVRGLLDQAQIALSDPRLSAYWRHAIQLAVDSLSATLTSAGESIGVGGGDSGGVPAQIAGGVSREVSETLQPGVEVFGRQFSEVWNPHGYERHSGQTYEPISDYERFILASDRQHTKVYVRSDTLSSEIFELCEALSGHVSGFDHPLTFEFDENGQHFEAHVGRARDIQLLFIRLAAQFSGDDRRYCSYTCLSEARWGDPSVGPKLIPSYEEGKYCVLSQRLYRPLSPAEYLQCKNLSSSRYRLDSPLAQKLRRSESPADYLWNDSLSYSPESDPAFREKMALFKPVSLDLIFQLIREHVAQENHK